MLRWLVPLVLLVPAFAQAPSSVAVPTTAPPAAGDVPVGKAELAVDAGPVRLQVFTYRPANWSGQRLLFVMHGVLRNADEYRDHAVGMADRFDALVVAPKFDSERFPSRLYQRGGILREDGSAAPPAEWTYARIPELAAAVRARTGKPDAQLFVIGHSAGGQFVVRMSAFQDTGAVRLVAANPGSVLLPTTDVPFGYGFGGLPPELANDARLQRYLAAPLTLYLGTGEDGAHVGRGPRLAVRLAARRSAGRRARPRDDVRARDVRGGAVRRRGGEAGRGKARRREARSHEEVRRSEARRQAGRTSWRRALAVPCAAAAGEPGRVQPSSKALR
jgi:dienelactone hydrolase